MFGMTKALTRLVNELMTKSTELITEAQTLSPIIAERYRMRAAVLYDVAEIIKRVMDSED